MRIFAIPSRPFEKDHERAIILGSIKVIADIKSELIDDFSHHACAAATDAADNHRTGCCEIVLHIVLRCQINFYGR